MAPIVRALLPQHSSQYLPNLAWSYAVANVRSPLLFDNDFTNDCDTGRIAPASPVEPWKNATMHLILGIQTHSISMIDAHQKWLLHRCTGGSKWKLNCCWGRQAISLCEPEANGQYNSGAQTSYYGNSTGVQ
ncbi:hypothetical protein ACHAWF_017498 [Thalassiosira exigua]